jgi:uncharacterized membrane protein YecN with MAPEG domain
MELKITPLYAAFLGIIFVFFSALVIKQRRKNKIAIGDGNNIALQKAIRAHGNFAEYTPFAIILVSFVELLDYHFILINSLMLAFTIGRIVHCYGVIKTKEDIRFRIFGMLMTFAVIILSSALILIDGFSET